MLSSILVSVNLKGRDYSGQDNHEEAIGKASWGNGKFGKALELDGASHGVKISPGLELKTLLLYFG